MRRPVRGRVAPAESRRSAQPGPAPRGGGGGLRRRGHLGSRRPHRREGRGGRGHAVPPLPDQGEAVRSHPHRPYRRHRRGCPGPDRRRGPRSRLLRLPGPPGRGEHLEARPDPGLAGRRRGDRTGGGPVQAEPRRGGGPARRRGPAGRCGAQRRLVRRRALLGRGHLYRRRPSAHDGPTRGDPRHHLRRPPAAAPEQPRRAARMKAAVYHRTGSPDVFRYEDVPDPSVGDSEILVKVEAISIEGGDTLSRQGGEMRTVPHVVGYQCAGTVVAVGGAVQRFVVGQRAVTVGIDGSHAELRAVPESFAWAIPDGLSTDEAACVPVPWGTADDCLFEFGHLRAGETVLVHAGASGVGIAAIQLAKRAGARVLATASSDDKLARLTELGLDEGINYVRDDFVAESRRLTEGRGVDVIVDSVGGATLQGSIRALAYRGRCVTVGDAGRSPAEHLDISTMRGNNQTLSGYFLGVELLMAPRAYAMIAGH